MKRKNVITGACLSLILMSAPHTRLCAQQEPDEQAKQLDLKMQLLDTKLDLLDSKISLWENKPAELDMKIREIDRRILELDFDPQEFNARMQAIENELLEVKDQLGAGRSEVPDFRIYEEQYQPVFTSAIMLNPVRLFEGTFHLAYERLLTDRFSVSVSALATYATQKGLTNYFFENQVFSYYDMSSRSYTDYSGESIAGGGIILEAKNYLLADFPMHRKAPLGLYAAPQVLFRKIWITGEEQVWEDPDWVTKEVKQRLNVLSSGVLLGYKMPLAKVL